MMNSKSLRFALAVLGIYIAWTLLSGMVLAPTPIGTKWLSAINGLLLGLLPLTYNLINGKRPHLPHVVALSCGFIAFIAFAICLDYLGGNYAGASRIIALTAGYLIGLCWCDGDKHSLTKISIGALVLAAVSAFVLCKLENELLSNAETRRLGASIATYFEMTLALLLGLALPLPKLTRHVIIPLAIFVVQFIIMTIALLGYSGVVRSGFVSFCAKLVLSDIAAYSYWLNAGIAGMLLRQIVIIALQHKQPGSQSILSASQNQSKRKA